jgi:hypothetical protein
MMGPLGTKWAGDNPSRVLAWLGVSFVATVGLLVLCAVTGRVELLVVSAIGGSVVMKETAIYAPRAWRATKHIRARG